MSGLLPRLATGDPQAYTVVKMSDFPGTGGSVLETEHTYRG